MPSSSINNVPGEMELFLKFYDDWVYPVKPYKFYIYFLWSLELLNLLDLWLFILALGATPSKPITIILFGLRMFTNIFM